MIIKNNISPLASALDGRSITYTKYRTIWDSALQELIPIIGHYFIEAISGADVRFRLTIPTACITSMGQIWINPQFFIDNIETPQDFAAILLHELLHPWVDPGLIRHGPMWNLVQDIAINAIIYNLSPKLASFFHKLYPNTYFMCLLTDKASNTMLEAQRKFPLQSTVLKLSIEQRKDYFSKYDFTKSRNKDTDTVLHPTDIGLLPIGPLQIKTYQSMYSGKDSSEFSNSIAIEVIREVFFPLTKEGFKDGQYVIIDGDGNEYSPQDVIDSYSNTPEQSPQEIQKASEDSETKELNKKLDEQAKEIKKSEKSSSNKNPSTGASKEGTSTNYKTVIKSVHDLQKEDRVQSNYSIIHNTHTSINKSTRSSVFKKTIEKAFPVIIKDIVKYSPAEDVKRAFKASALNDVRNSILDSMAFKNIPTRTIIPLQIPKRAVTSLALGYLPTWYKKNNPIPEAKEATKSIVYMDVSGSFMSYIPWTLGLITAMKDRCNTDKLFVFSTELYQTSMQDITTGNYKSTGGTSFEVVLQHFMSTPEKKALMITDGYDNVSTNTKQKLKELGKSIYVLVIGSYSEGVTLDWATKTFNYVIKDN